MENISGRSVVNYPISLGQEREIPGGAAQFLLSFFDEKTLSHFAATCKKNWHAVINDASCQKVIFAAQFLFSPFKYDPSKWETRNQLARIKQIFSSKNEMLNSIELDDNFCYLSDGQSVYILTQTGFLFTYDMNGNRKFCKNYPQLNGISYIQAKMIDGFVYFISQDKIVIFDINKKIKIINKANKLLGINATFFGLCKSENKIIISCVIKNEQNNCHQIVDFFSGDVIIDTAEKSCKYLDGVLFTKSQYWINFDDQIQGPFPNIASPNSELISIFHPCDDKLIFFELLPSNKYQMVVKDIKGIVKRSLIFGIPLGNICKDENNTPSVTFIGNEFFFKVERESGGGRWWHPITQNAWIVGYSFSNNASHFMSREIPVDATNISISNFNIIYRINNKIVINYFKLKGEGSK